MEKNFEPVYLYCRNQKYYATPSIELAIQRSTEGEVLVLNNQSDQAETI